MSGGLISRNDGNQLYRRQGVANLQISGASCSLAVNRPAVRETLCIFLFPLKGLALSGEKPLSQLSALNALVRHQVGYVHEVRTGREIQKLFRLISIRHRFEVPVGAKIHCDDYVISFVLRSLYVKRANPIFDLCNSVLVC
jgi:hypothetical protein